MPTLWPAPESLLLATDHQREKYSLATRSPVAVLGGNPGAGKTFLTAQIIKCVAREYGSDQIGVAAPTGKAAQRICEVMAEYKVDANEATTIHRMLQVGRNGHDQKGWGFQVNADNPLRKRFLFVDEASMLGTTLAASLLDAIQPGTHVMFIGDFAQLPPVEHGAPLRDMIEGGQSYGELVKIRRNSGTITDVCEDLKQGRGYHPAAYPDVEKGLNLVHIPASRPATTLAALRWIIQNAPTGIDPMWDVQVLSPLNKAESELNVTNVNRLLQDICNPGGERVDKLKFRLGDKVICTSNGGAPVVACGYCDGDRKKPLVWDGKQFYECGHCGRMFKPKELVQDFVANGEMGKVVAVYPGAMHVEYESPARTVRVAGNDLDSYDLGYCATVHKAQGSQWKCPILLADDSNAADRVTSWEHWRTGISRAERLGFTIGSVNTINRQCRKSALKDRKTFLQELLSA